MNRSRLTVPARTLGAALLATGLAGCSAEATGSDPPSSSRMIRPSEIPEVSVSSNDDASNMDGTENTTTQYVDVPEQIWVRSASYANKTYTLTLATASGGKFDVYDAHGVGGLDGGAPTSDCSVTSEKPLTTRPKGAITAVSHLVTMICPALTPLKLPVVDGQWGDLSKGGMTQAIFVVGGSEKQGRPLAPSEPPVDVNQKIDGMVVSVKHQGGDLTVRAWATEYVNLTVSKSDGNDPSPPECATKTLPGTRAGVQNRTPQRLFEVTCSHLPSLAGYSLSSMSLFGAAGQVPTALGSSTDLTAGAKITG